MTHPANRWLLLVPPLLVLFWLLSQTPLYLDDVGYLMWAHQSAGDALSLAKGPTWTGHWRPLNHLAWLIAWQLDVSATFVRVLQVVALTFSVVFLAIAAHRRHGVAGAASVVAALTGYQVFLDILGWKSWLTTAGTLVGLAIGLVELGREPPRWWVVVLAGLLALGFKEPGCFVLGVAALATWKPRVREAGGALVLVAVGVGLLAMRKVVPGALLHNAGAHLEAVGHGAFLLPILVTVIRPQTHWGWVVASGLVALLPGWLAGPVVLLAIAAALWGRWAWVVALGSAWGVPLVGATAARQYLMEGWLVVAAFLGLVRPPTHRWVVWLTVAVAAIPQAMQYAPERARKRAELAQEQAFLAEFDPAPAPVIYRPDPMYPLELDALVWMHRGAELSDEVAPQGMEPALVGPSRVWVGPLRPD